MVWRRVIWRGHGGLGAPRMVMVHKQETTIGRDRTGCIIILGELIEKGKYED